MRVVLATTFQPFVRGGADLMVDWLDAELAKRGHEVEVFRFPFVPQYPRMLDQMLALRLFDMSWRGDRMICVRTPSYLLRHPNKVVWFIHHHRPAYDLRGTPYGDNASDLEAARYQEAVRNADQAALSEGKVFCNSRVMARRLKEFNGIDSEVLYPPLPECGNRRSGPGGDYFIYVSRISSHKRQNLAIEALRHTRTPVKLVLAGPAESPEYLESLRALVAKHRLQDRVTILAEWIPDEKKDALIAGCLAGVYTPFDEDSYGYASLEVQQAGKALVVTNDSGGPLELIADGHNGLICRPRPQSIAESMDRLFTDREEAVRMGNAGPLAILELGARWDHVIERLLA